MKERRSQLSMFQRTPKSRTMCSYRLPSQRRGLRRGKRTTTTSESQRQERTRVSRQVCVRTHARPCTRQEEKLTYLSGIPSVLRTVLIGVTQVKRKSCGFKNIQRMGGPRGGAEDPAHSGGYHGLESYDHEDEGSLAKRCIPHTIGYICPNEREN